MKIIDLEVNNYKEIYNYHLKLNSPYFYKVDYQTWLNSFINDYDNYNRLLFKKLYVKVLYENNTIVGYIQCGYTNFGFNDCGEISDNISYCVIRNFYFEEDNINGGQ